MPVLPGPVSWCHIDYREIRLRVLESWRVEAQAENPSLELLFLDLDFVCDMSREVNRQ